MISRITEDVFVLGGRVICRGFLHTLLFADALRSGGRLGYKASFVITAFAILFNLVPVGEKTRSIASLQGRILIIPDLGVIIVVWSIYTFLSV
jgi:hypothetical protein